METSGIASGAVLSSSREARSPRGIAREETIGEKSKRMLVRVDGLMMCFLGMKGAERLMKKRMTKREKKKKKKKEGKRDCGVR
jgi:hypothetical protein